jgi:glc operon protein GlcG
MELVASKKAITLEAARIILARATEKALELAVPGAIAVVDDAGNLVCLERLDGTMPAASAIAIGKAATSAVFRRPTLLLEQLVQDQRLVMLGLNGITNTPYVPLMGGYPILAGEEVIGAIAVAGARTGENDEIIAKYAAEYIF